MRKGAAVVSWALCVGLILPLCAGHELVAQEGADDALKHMKEGLRQYDLGELGKALAELEQVVRLTPGSAEALTLLERVGEQNVYKLLENEKTRAQAQRLFDLAKKEEARKATDPKEIMKHVKDLSGDFPARWRGTSPRLGVRSP